MAYKVEAWWSIEWLLMNGFYKETGAPGEWKYFLKIEGGYYSWSKTKEYQGWGLETYERLYDPRTNASGDPASYKRLLNGLVPPEWPPPPKEEGISPGRWNRIET